MVQPHRSFAEEASQIRKRLGFREVESPSAAQFWPAEGRRLRTPVTQPETPRHHILLGRDVDTGDPFYIQPPHLRRHVYIIGASGAGKTKFIESLIGQEIEQHNGFGVIDHTADLIEHIKGRIACAYQRTQDEEILNRVVVIDPTHPTHTATFNPLELLPNTSPAEQAAELVNVFHKIWSDSWGISMEAVMQNSFIALGEAGLTLVDMIRFFDDPSFRAGVIERLKHPIARSYFEDFETRSRSAKAQIVSPVRTRLSAFLTNDRIRQMLSSPQSSFNLREIMDTRKILLVNINESQLKDAAWLLGALFVAKIKMAACSRADILESQRVPFRLYVDEFARFATEDFRTVLSETRKFGLSFVMAHQDFTQVSPALKGAVLTNAAVRVCFRVRYSDAQDMAREFFQYEEDEIKRERLLQSGEISYTYRSSGEQRERLTRDIQHLPDRTCYVNNTFNDTTTCIRTLEVIPNSEILGMSEYQAQDYIAALPIGRNYVIDREQLARETAARNESNAGSPNRLSLEERTFLTFLSDNTDTPLSAVYKSVGMGVPKGNRLRDTLKEKELIVEIEIRRGVGKPPTFMIPTSEALELLGIEPPPGRGGAIHRHLQQMIVASAEAKGYQAEVEKGVANGGIVDVHLQKDGQRIAVEIAVVSKPERELAHITHCLEGGYGKVFSIFADERLLAKTQERLNDSFSAEQRSKIQLLSVKELRQVLLNNG